MIRKIYRTLVIFAFILTLVVFYSVKKIQYFMNQVTTLEAHLNVLVRDNNELSGENKELRRLFENLRQDIINYEAQMSEVEKKIVKEEIKQAINKIKMGLYNKRIEYQKEYDRIKLEEGNIGVIQKEAK